MPKKGIVGVFDILGYQNIINNNQIEDAAKLISETLMKLPDKVIDEFIAGAGNDPARKEEVIKDLNKINRLIVSDTIILTLPSDDDAFNWIMFIIYTAQLLRLSFDSGLPLRGAIDYGVFFTNELCFAGRTIINSYNLSNKLQFSGCVLTADAKEKYLSITHKKDPLVYEYLVPFKNEIEEKHLIINWLQPFEDWGELPTDIKQYVLKAFHAHNKDVARNVLPILENTELMLRYSLIKKGL